MWEGPRMSRWAVILELVEGLQLAEPVNIFFEVRDSERTWSPAENQRHFGAIDVRKPASDGTIHGVESPGGEAVSISQRGTY